MDARIAKLRRTSRWTRDPVIVDGRLVVAYPTERDVEIFRSLARYRYLPSDYIHAFTAETRRRLRGGSISSPGSQISTSPGRTSSARAPAPITGR